MLFPEKKITRFKARITGMKQEYSSFEAHHRELAEYILPRLGRWLLSDTNRGGKKNGKIIDNTGKMALGTLSAGMMSGLTSPARPWFNLQHPDPEMEERTAVKTWNNTVRERMTAVFAKSNLYDSLPKLYSELILFGQGVMAEFEDIEDVIFTQNFTQGEYWIANDDKGQVNTFSREYKWTVGQIVEKYGYENCSATVKGHFDRQNFDAWVDLFHIVEFNQGRDFDKADSINKRFRSVIWEQASSKEVLDFKGYDEFPLFGPRWDVNSGDVYASSCPGMDALGDIKQLQLHEKRCSEAVEKIVRPPMVADPSMRNRHKSQMPGGVTYSTFINGKPGFQEAYKVDPRINELEIKSQQIRERINKAFYADLFLMMTNTDRRQITAREVAERHEEKLLMLGPVLERLNKDLLDPLINRTFNIMWRRGMIPPPPPELEGADIKIEYISVLHQAQRSVGVSTVDRLLGFASNVTALNPSSRHKVNFDQMLDVYADMLGTPPALIRSDDEAAALAEAENQAINRQQTLMAGVGAAKATKDLADAKVTDDSALSTLVNSISQ